MAARKDPELRQVMSSDDEGKIKNADPRMFYVLAYKGDEDTGLNHYLELGYEVVRHSDDGERLRVGNTGEEGTPIEWKGHVLCRILKSVRDERLQHGGNGWGMGLDYVDMVDKKILKTGGIDGIRGGHSGLDVINETGRTQSVAG